MPPINKAKKSGLTLPGYKYLGPFNSLFAGKPVNKADEAARRHDLGYTDLLDKGHNPYIYFNDHDEQLIQDLQTDRTFGGILAKSVFSIKKAVAPALPNTKTKQAERAAKRKLYFARSNKHSKQAKMEDPNMDHDADAQAPDQPDGVARSGGGGAVGSSGRGGSGVGYSTGGWTGGSIFTDDIVVTKNTRQFICEIKNGHLYKTETLNTGAQHAAQYACTTPWSYFNFNQYSSHFSPHDWQKLINEYTAFRPVKMQVRIYNLQIKQIVTDGAQGNTYNNDLTAGLHIMCDGSHAYPYVQHPWDDECMPELPNQIWKLPQYAYLYGPIESIDEPTNGAEADIKKGIPLYILENTDHEVLRTGEATEFTFNFGDCEWVENNISSILPQMMYNPLVKNRKVYNIALNQAKQQVAAVKSSNWWPGPGLKDGTYSNNTETQASGPYITRTDNHNIIGDTPDGKGYSTWPARGAISHNLSSKDLHYVTGTEGDASPTLWYNKRHTMTRDYVINKLTAATGTSEIVNDWFMLPNQTWDSHPIARYNPIWVKVPRVNRKTMFDTQDGTIPMEHPPGTVFMKLAKIPIPGTGDSFLTIYATGQVSCEIVWQVKKTGSKNWRPEYRHTVSDMNIDAYRFNEAGNYYGAREPNDAMQTRYGHSKVL
uniref:Minor capsid protein VP1 n=1 Tax=bovine bocaparvovirus 2 TaxID=1864484 RepID=A0A193AUM5_9VIRU|nr:structural protein [Ungulate bocaparvovirus 6]